MSRDDFKKFRTIINKQGEERCVHHFVKHLAEVQLRLEKLYLADSKRTENMNELLLLVELCKLQIWLHIVRMIFDKGSYSKDYKKYVKKEIKKYALYK